MGNNQLQAGVDGTDLFIQGCPLAVNSAVRVPMAFGCSLSRANQKRLPHRIRTWERTAARGPSKHFSCVEH